MKNENQEAINFLFGYCRYLSQELKNRDEKLERVEKQLEEEVIKKQQYKQELVDTSVTDRWKIGKFLHDNLAQKLTYAQILISFLKSELSKERSKLTIKCDDVIEIINESARDVRDLSHDIIPVDVEKEGVAQTFIQLKEQTKKQGVNCSLETDGIIHKINKREIATNLYHIAQEAIKNAVVHGEAKNIKIALIEHEAQLYMHVKDDGEGLDSTEVKENHGMGITIMKHRAEEMGGTLRIRNAEKADNYSTYVTCTIPIQVLDSQ